MNKSSKQVGGRKVSVKNIWMVTREYGDIAGAGGVRDVVCQLSKNLSIWNGRSVSVVLPLYGFVDLEKHGFAPVYDDNNIDNGQLSFPVEMNYVNSERQENIKIWSKKDGRVTVYGLESDRFSEKSDVYVYTEEDDDGVSGVGHYDFFAMNLLLQKGAADLIMQLQEIPDIIHCHDGHTAILPVLINELAGYRNYFKKTACLITIHNAGYGYHQEIGDLKFAKAITGLTWQTIMESKLDNKFDPFIAGAKYSVVNTVSENYAWELQHTSQDELTGWLGTSLADRGSEIIGITNGIEPEEYNVSEAGDLGLAASYDIENDEELAGKLVCKKEFLRKLGAIVDSGIRQTGFLEYTPEKALFTFVGRLNSQKGVDVMLGAIAEIFLRRQDCQILVLGNGDAVFEEQLVALAEKDNLKGRICFLKGFDPEIANFVFAAGDFFLIPSNFEPCGLTDYIAQLFGNIPVVHEVGGLIKVLDGETGLSYRGNSVQNLATVMEKCLTLFESPKEIRRIQKNAKQLIDEKYSWKKIMKQYVKVYKQAAENQ